MQSYQLLQEDTLQIIENIDMNFVDEPKKQKQSNRIFLHEDLAIKIIM